ncbi:MAG: thiamine pyrophosphate-dependent acetolactate synthase large subunit-like protein [Rhodothermales bacterium]|jgi:thiamine pyrophosphate-dependent acetolactate synthase large subunit-like protein
MLQTPDVLPSDDVGNNTYSFGRYFQATNPSFAKVAHQCGAMGLIVTDPSQLEDRMRAALDHNGPALVEVVTDALLI